MSALIIRLWTGKRRLLGLAFAVLAGVVLVSSDAVAQQYSFDTYDEIDGLPSPDVHAVMQDREGYIWVATRAGVARYDGYEWVRFSAGQGGIGTGTMHAGPDAEVWLVSHRGHGALSRWDGQTWSEGSIPPRPDQGAVIDSTLAWVGGAPVLMVIRSEGEGASLYARDRWTETPLEVRPRQVSATRDGFLVAHDRGLVRFSPRTGVYTAVSDVPAEPILAALEDGDRGWIWLVGHGWLGRVGPEGFTKLEEGLALGKSEYNFQLVPDGFGGVYLGNLHGLAHYGLSVGLERLDRNSGHAAGTAADLLLDRERNLWVASYRGLSKLNSLSLKSFDSKHGLLDDEVSAILTLRSGRTVLGHKHGLTFLEDPPRTLSLGTDPVQTRVMDLDEDSEGTLWLAASFSGLARIPKGGELEWVPSVGEQIPLVMALHRDAAGVLWVGGMSGMGTLRGDTFTPHPALAGLGQIPTVRSISECGDRMLFATRELGVFALAGGELVPLDGLSGDGLDAYVALCMSSAEVWAGTMGGLRVQGEAPEGLALSRPVYALGTAPDQAVWLGSDDGYYRWEDGALQHLGIFDGLLGTEANRHAIGFQRDEVWLGTDRGLNVYRPEYDQPASQPPTVQVASATANAEPFDLAGPLTLEPSRNALGFRIRAISFADEDRVQFRTWLEGLEGGFSEPLQLPTREIRYPYLPPGTYRLHVRAVGADGQESQTASTPPITVQAPLGQRVWFRALVALEIALAVLLFGSFLFQRRQAGRLEKAVAERTAELEASRAATVAESERLLAMLRSIHDAVVVTDAVGRIALWNDAAESLFGVERAQAIGRKLVDVVEEEVPRRGVFERIHARGTRRTIEVSSSSISSPRQEDGGTVMAFRDITERLRAEADQRRAGQIEALGILAGGIAHDFNNLLTVLLANLSLVQEEMGPNKLVDHAVAAAWQAESLTRQLLTFSKGGAPVCNATAIGDLVRECTDFALRGASTRPVYELPDDLWEVEVDTGQISQLVQNLVLNAREAMTDGGLLTLSAENLQTAPDFLPAGRYVVIHVRDNGPGIPPELVDKVFDPYFSTKKRGSGLGLTTAYSIVDRHKGRLKVSSELGVGTRFSFYLPASAAERSAVAPQAPPAVVTEPAKILVLEDEEGIRDVVRTILETAGHEACFVRDGQMVLEPYQRAQRSGAPFDVVLMDLTIPGGCGGREALGILQAFDPKVRAIVASGYSDDPVLSNPEHYGFMASVTKPFSGNQLLAAISRVQGA